MNYKETILAAAAIVAIGGCTEQGREAYHDADQTQSQAAQQFANAAKTDAKATSDALKKSSAGANAGLSRDLEKSKTAMAGIGAKLNNAEVTAKVKSSLASASGLDTTDITVETTGKTIWLKGVAANATQKKQAEQIAKGIAGTNYTVKDQLTLSTP